VLRPKPLRFLRHCWERPNVTVKKLHTGKEVTYASFSREIVYTPLELTNEDGWLSGGSQNSSAEDSKEQHPSFQADVFTIKSDVIARLLALPASPTLSRVINCRASLVCPMGQTFLGARGDYTLYCRNSVQFIRSILVQAIDNLCI